MTKGSAARAVWAALVAVLGVACDDDGLPVEDDVSLIPAQALVELQKLSPATLPAPPADPVTSVLLRREWCYTVRGRGGWGACPAVATRASVHEQVAGDRAEHSARDTEQQRAEHGAPRDERPRRGGDAGADRGARTSAHRQQLLRGSRRSMRAPMWVREVPVCRGEGEGRNWVHRP